MLCGAVGWGGVRCSLRRAVWCAGVGEVGVLCIWLLCSMGMYGPGVGHVKALIALAWQSNDPLGCTVLSCDIVSHGLETPAHMPRAAEVVHDALDVTHHTKQHCYSLQHTLCASLCKARQHVLSTSAADDMQSTLSACCLSHLSCWLLLDSWKRVLVALHGAI